MEAGQNLMQVNWLVKVSEHMLVDKIHVKSVGCDDDTCHIQSSAADTQCNDDDIHPVPHGDHKVSFLVHDC